MKGSQRVTFVERRLGERDNMGCHRIGYLYENFISEENCIKAEERVGKNKKHNRNAKELKNIQNIMQKRYIKY